MAVGWRDAPMGAPEAAVAALEHALSRPLPEEFRAFLLEHDGGEPNDNEFSIPEAGESGINEFLSVKDIVDELERGGLPDGYVPVAYAEGGNQVLVALDTGRVFFWDHERVDGLSEVGGSFTSFFEDLRPFDVSRVTLKPGQVKDVWIDPDLLA